MTQRVNNTAAIARNPNAPITARTTRTAVELLPSPICTLGLSTKTRATITLIIKNNIVTQALSAFAVQTRANKVRACATRLVSA